MATLAAQLKTDYDLLTVETHYDETDLTRVAALAAAFTKRYAGDVDGDDLEAVVLGLEYMTYLVEKSYKLLGPEDLQAKMVWLRGEFEDMRAQRIQESATPVVVEADD